jgi:uncharacterized protein YcnI
MTASNFSKSIALLAICTWAGTSLAHIVLEQKAAPAAAYYKAVFQVGHGCKGAATTAVRVQIPAAFKGAKPMPKAGWTLATESDAITWTAVSPANALPDGQYDEFLLRGRTPDTPGPLWFAVRQLCDAVVQDWAEVPATGTSTQGMKWPAALLQVTGASVAPAVQPSATAATPKATPAAPAHQH